MNILEKAKDLALDLKASDEFNEWMEVKSLIADTVEEKAILQQYHGCLLVIDLCDLSGDGLASAQKTLDETYDQMMRNDLLSRYLTAEENFLGLLQDLQQVFAETIDLCAEDILPMPTGSMGGFLN